jgi:hypothetical protein
MDHSHFVSPVLTTISWSTPPALFPQPLSLIKTAYSSTSRFARNALIATTFQTKLVFQSIPTARTTAVMETALIAMAGMRFPMANA